MTQVTLDFDDELLMAGIAKAQAEKMSFDVWVKGLISSSVERKSPTKQEVEKSDSNSRQNSQNNKQDWLEQSFMIMDKAFDEAGLVAGSMSGQPRDWTRDEIYDRT